MGGDSVGGDDSVGGGDSVGVLAGSVLRKEDGPLVEATELVEPDDVEQDDRDERDAWRDERINTGVVHQLVLGTPARKRLACGEVIAPW